MKLTKTQLKKIIKEEISKNLKEIAGMPGGEEYAAALGAPPPEGAFGGHPGMITDIMLQNFVAPIPGIEVEDLPAEWLAIEDPAALDELLADYYSKVWSEIPFDEK